MFELDIFKSFKRPRPASDDEQGQEVYFKRQRIKTAKRRKTIDEKPILACPHCDREFRYEKPYEKHLKEHQGSDWRDDSNHNDAVIDEIEPRSTVIPFVLMDPHEEAAAAAAALLELDKDDDSLRDDYYDYFAANDWSEEAQERLELNPSDPSVVDESAFVTVATEAAAVVVDPEEEFASIADCVADELCVKSGPAERQFIEEEPDPAEAEQPVHEESAPAEQPTPTASANAVIDAPRTKKRKSRRSTKDDLANETAKIYDVACEQTESAQPDPHSADSVAAVAGEPACSNKRRRSGRRKDAPDAEATAGVDSRAADVNSIDASASSKSMPPEPNSSAEAAEPSSEPEKKKKRRRSSRRNDTSEIEKITVGDGIAKENRVDEKHTSTPSEHPPVEAAASTDAQEKTKKRTRRSKRNVKDASEEEPAVDEVSPVVASEEGDELTTPADSNPPSVPTTKSESKRRNSRKRAEVAKCADAVFESGDPDEKDHSPDEPKDLAVLEAKKSDKPSKRRSVKGAPDTESIEKPKKAKRESMKIIEGVSAAETASVMASGSVSVAEISEKASNDESDKIPKKRRTNRRSTLSIEDHAPPSASSAESNPAADEAVAVQPAALASDAADSVERSEKSKRKSRRRTEQADSVADEAASVALKGSDAVEQLDQLDKKKGKHRRRIEKTPSPIEVVTVDRSAIAAADESNTGKRKIRRSIKESALAKEVEQTNEQQDLMEPEPILSEEAKSSKDLKKGRSRKSMKEASELSPVADSAADSIAAEQAPTEHESVPNDASASGNTEKSEKKTRKSSISRKSDEAADNCEMETDESIVESEQSAEKVVAKEVKPTLTCAVCERTFKYEGNYKKHLLAHEEEMEVDKESCAEDDDIGIETDKSNEVNISKEKSTFACAVCEREFVFEGNYKKHMSTHEEKKEESKNKEITIPVAAEPQLDAISPATAAPSKELSCPICDRKYKYEGHYKKHMLAHEEEKEKPEDTIPATAAPSKELTCPICERKYKYEGHYKNHLLTHEEVEEDDKKIETDASSSSDVATTVKDEPAPELPSKKFKCPSCVRTFKYEGHYKRHLLRHELNEATSMNTSAHEKFDVSLEAAPPPAAEIEGKKSFSCTTCHRRYEDEWRYKNHMVAHATAMDISDDEDISISDEKSEKKTDRSASQRKSIAEKPLLTCRFCEQNFKYDVCYKKHMKTHGDGCDLTEVSEAAQPLVIITSSMLKWRISEEIVNNFRINVECDVAGNCAVSSVVESAAAAIEFIVDAIEVDEHAASLARLPSPRQHHCLSPSRDVQVNGQDREIDEGLWPTAPSLSDTCTSFHTNALAPVQDQRRGADSSTNDQTTKNLDDNVVQSSTGDVCTLRTGLKLKRPDRLIFTGSKYCPAPAISTWAWSRSK